MFTLEFDVIVDGINLNSFLDAEMRTVEGAMDLKTPSPFFTSEH